MLDNHNQDSLWKMYNFNVSKLVSTSIHSYNYDTLYSSFLIIANPLLKLKVTDFNLLKQLNTLLTCNELETSKQIQLHKTAL